MKKLLIIIFGVTLMQCDTTKKVELDEYLLGNWYYCDNNEDYTELYINKEKIIWSPETWPDGMHLTYYIKGDSVITIDQNDDVGSYKVEIINDNKMIHSWKGSDNEMHIYKLVRIKDSILTPFDAKKLNEEHRRSDYFDEIFFPQFWDRMKKNSCK